MTKLLPYQTPRNEAFLQRVHQERAARQEVAPILARYDITLMEWLLLGAVARNEDRRVRMSNAAESLGVTLPQVTALANRVLESKLIRYKIDPKDRRARQLELTGKGLNALEYIEEALSGHS